MKLKYLGVLFSIFSVFYLIGCGSTPKAEEPAPVSREAEEPTASEKMLAEVENARKAAIEAGAENNFPQLFADTEKSYKELKAAVEANRDADNSAQLADLVARYKSMEKASKAKAMKAKIEGMDPSTYDKKAYDKGTEALAKYESMDSSTSGAELLAHAELAYGAYNVIVNKGLTAMAGRERKAALEAKKNADSVKAGVAKKTEYKKASDLFKKADSAYVTLNIEGAYEDYKSAKEIFNDLYETVKQNRAAAQAALDRAKQKVAEAASTAAEADKSDPLTTKVAGIESVYSVLLSVEKFANPEDAVIDVESGATAETAKKEAAAAIAVDEVSQEAK